MKLSVGSNSQRGPRHGEAAGFRVPKDFSGEKERNGSNFIKAGGRGRQRRRKASAQRKIYAPTPPDRRSGPGFIRKGREQGRKEGRAEGRGEGGEVRRFPFKDKGRLARPSFLGLSRALLPFLLPSIGGRAHVFKRRPSLCKPARTCSDLPLDLSLTVKFCSSSFFIKTYY